MGRIGRLLLNEIEKVVTNVVETRFGLNQVCDQFSPSGDDSPPLPQDRILLVRVDGAGSFKACGVLTANKGAKPGEKILYSRDQQGNVKAVLRMLNDGTIEGVAPGHIDIQTDGTTDWKSKDTITVQTDGETDWKSKKTITVKTDEQLNVESKKETLFESKKQTTIKSPATVLTGGSVTLAGSGAADGTGCLCGIHFCYVTGAPVSCSTSSGN